MAEAVTVPADQNRATIPAQTSIGTVGVLLSPPKPGRVLFRIENTGLTVLYVNFSATVPTSSVYHVSLAGGGSANGGAGGVFSVDGWAGPVTGLSSASGGTAVITEFLVPAAWG